MSLVQISVFLCHQGFLPSPYVSTFHLQGLWAAASEEAARLRHFEADRGVKKNLIHSG